jgi:Mg-chelatase subunit ChlD
MKTQEIALAILALVCVFIPFAGQAQPSAVRPLDLVLVLDNSGSMKKNDPEALMSKAVSAFAGSLPPDSRLGIVVFDQEVRPALALAPTSGADFQIRVAQALRGINYRGQWTDIAGGIERAIYELRQQGRADAQRAVILFTDGVLETGNATKDAERARWLQDNLAAEAKQIGIRVFGIAFTEGADFRLLQSVAQTTGAEHYRVLKAAEIGAVFERVRSRIQQLADDSARRGTVQAPAVATEPGAAVTPPAVPAVPWLWLVALVLAGGATVWVVAVVRARPAVTGGLRDVGGHSGSKVHPLRRKLTRIGRDPAHNDLVIAHDTMSAQHAEIEIRGANFYLKDLNSSNHTFVNGKEIKEQVLKHGDRLRFDAFEFEFSIDGYAAASDASGAPVTPGGTRLRDPTASPGPAAARPAPPAPLGAAAVTRVKTGKCNVHESWDAVDVCSRCGFEKCRACLSDLDGVQVCIDCATAPAR